MYYDSKSDFYIRQYGPKVAILVLSVALVISGLYIYCSTRVGTNTTDNSVVVANSENTEKTNDNENKVVETEQNSLQNIEDKNTVESNVVEEVKKDEEIVISKGLTASLKNLPILEKTSKATVSSVTEKNTIIVKLNSYYYEVNLIGIDYANSTATINNKLKEDLTDKEVKLAFDKVRVKDGQVYAYVYLSDDVSYNETLLKEGQARLKVESTNTSLLSKFVDAQKTAKSNNVGIWAKK